ncbi:hypothetical protein KKI24_11805 [bacterium]|nr:hypothetical protein [bacterium]
MTEKNSLIIYEYLNPDGDPDVYICAGHVDSMTFREAVHRKFSVKPLVVQHRWRRTRRIVKRDEEKKRARGYTTDVTCLSEEPGARAVTVGLL